MDASDSGAGAASGSARSAGGGGGSGTADPAAQKHEVFLASTRSPPRKHVAPVDRAFEAFTHVGLRDEQEDRLVLCPRFLGRDDMAFAAVFDGTVGDAASHFCQQNVLDVLRREDAFGKGHGSQAGAAVVGGGTRGSSGGGAAGTGSESAIAAVRRAQQEKKQREQQTSQGTGAASSSSSSSSTAAAAAASAAAATATANSLFDHDLSTRDSLMAAAKLMSMTMRQTFLRTDAALLEHCRQRALHYASSTGVAAFLFKNLLTVAHVGDSKACLARVDGGGEIRTEWLTTDHKPNDQDELQRIEAAGGSLVYLHGNKPYIRGADFKRRQANDEHPKQLNYSRAFGGKDLKMYGLSAEPDVSHFEVKKDARLLLIASDGLWDVVSADRAVDIVMQERRAGNPSPTSKLVEFAIHEMPRYNVRDNVTVVAVYLNESTFAR